MGIWTLYKHKTNVWETSRRWHRMGMSIVPMPTFSVRYYKDGWVRIQVRELHTNINVILPQFQYYSYTVIVRL